MLIDWFTVVAQTLNFLILVWLLKRFLYGPILAAIDAREKSIAKKLADADVKKAEALAERNEFQRKNAAFEQEHAARLQAMTDNVRSEQQRLFAEAQQAANRLSANRRAALVKEADSFNKLLSSKAQQEVFAIARKTLTDLANVSLEKAITDVFIQRIQQMDGELKNTLTEAQKNSTEPALVRTAFALTEAQQNAIQSALDAVFSHPVALSFAVAPAQISGIELTCNGQKIAWSIADYLQTLQQRIDAVIDQKAGAL